MTVTNVAELPQQTKTCCKCGEGKPLSRFSPRAKDSHLLRSYCKDCAAGMGRKHRVVNPEYKANERTRSSGRRGYQGEWNRANRESRNAKSKARYKPATECKVFFLICQQTGKLFASKREYTKYSEEGLRIRARDCAINRYHETKVLVPHTTKPCKECKRLFTGTTRILYCSPKCVRMSVKRATRLDNTHQRRAKKYGVEYVAFDVIKILERDKWRCQLCGIKTPKNKRGTMDDNAPELDHIIPLSKGGGHTPSNVQCACRGCNGRKGNEIRGQLTLLI